MCLCFKIRPMALGPPLNSNLILPYIKISPYLTHFLPISLFEETSLPTSQA